MNLKSNSYILAASFAGMAFFGMAFVVMGAVLPSLSAKPYFDLTVGYLTPNGLKAALKTANFLSLSSATYPVQYLTKVFYLYGAKSATSAT